MVREKSVQSPYKECSENCCLINLCHVLEAMYYKMIHTKLNRCSYHSVTHPFNVFINIFYCLETRSQCSKHRHALCAPTVGPVLVEVAGWVMVALSIRESFHFGITQHKTTIPLTFCPQQETCPPTKQRPQGKTPFLRKHRHENLCLYFGVQNLPKGEFHCQNLHQRNGISHLYSYIKWQIKTIF